MPNKTLITLHDEWISQVEKILFLSEAILKKKDKISNTSCNYYLVFLLHLYLNRLLFIFNQLQSNVSFVLYQLYIWPNSYIMGGITPNLSHIHWENVQPTIESHNLPLGIKMTYLNKWLTWPTLSCKFNSSSKLPCVIWITWWIFCLAGLAACCGGCTILVY